MLNYTSRRIRQTGERRIPVWVWTLLGVISAIAVAVFIVVNVFVLDTVIIKNNTLYESATIKNAILSDEWSWNTLYVYFKYKLNGSEGVPFVDSMEIKMTDPDTLVVTVYEKGILGSFYQEDLDMYVYFDTEGYVTEISTRVIEDVPRIQGLETEEPVLFEQLPIGIVQLRDLLTLTQTLRRNDIVPNQITYGGNNGPILSYPNNVQIVVGTMTNLTQKVERMAAILPLLTEPGILHLENWSEETTNIVFERGLKEVDEYIAEHPEITVDDEEPADGEEGQTGEESADGEGTGEAGQTGEAGEEGLVEEDTTVPTTTQTMPSQPSMSEDE